MLNKLCLRLIVDVIYDPSGVSTQELKGLLEAIIPRAAGDGLLTGETPATVDTYYANVSVYYEPREDS